MTLYKGARILIWKDNHGQVTVQIGCMHVCQLHMHIKLKNKSKDITINTTVGKDTPKMKLSLIQAQFSIGLIENLLMNEAFITVWKKSVLIIACTGEVQISQM